MALLEKHKLELEKHQSDESTLKEDIARLAGQLTHAQQDKTKQTEELVRVQQEKIKLAKELANMQQDKIKLTEEVANIHKNNATLAEEVQTQQAAAQKEFEEKAGIMTHPANI